MPCMYLAHALYMSREVIPSNTSIYIDALQVPVCEVLYTMLTDLSCTAYSIQAILKVHFCLRDTLHGFLLSIA